MMTGRSFLTVILISGFSLILNIFPSYAQKQARTLTILYSNNLNAEIDPCPT
jgi:hypothetical protein